MMRLDSLLPATSNTTSGFRQSGAANSQTNSPEGGLAGVFTSLIGSLASTETANTAPETPAGWRPPQSDTGEQPSGDHPTLTPEAPAEAAQDGQALTATATATPPATAVASTANGSGPSPATMPEGQAAVAASQPTMPTQSAAAQPSAARPAQDTPALPQPQSQLAGQDANTKIQLQQTFEALQAVTASNRDQRSGQMGSAANQLSGTQLLSGGAEHRPDANQGAHRLVSAAEWAPVKVNTQHTQWSRDLAAALGDRLNMQISQNVKEASVRLDPPDLGRIELTVRLDGDRLNIQLNASSAQVRDMLSQHADRLRNDLIAQNNQTVEVEVGQQRERGGNGQPQAEQEVIASGLPMTEAETADTQEQPSDRWLSTSA